jgi:hypothetical protein
MRGEEANSYMFYSENMDIKEGKIEEKLGSRLSCIRLDLSDSGL